MTTRSPIFIGSPGAGRFPSLAAGFEIGGGWFETRPRTRAPKRNESKEHKSYCAAGDSRQNGNQFLSGRITKRSTAKSGINRSPDNSSYESYHQAGGENAAGRRPGECLGIRTDLTHVHWVQALSIPAGPFLI
jgi:phage gpG-like protein